MASTVGVCEPERLERCSTRPVRALAARPLVALVAAMLPLAAVAHGCGGDAPAPDDTGAAGASGDYQIDLDLPPEIGARVLEIATELGAAICERARSCCDHFGFRPRTDCVQMGGEIFAYRMLGVAGLGEVDLSELDFSINEAMAERCIDIARSLSHQCTFPAIGVVDWFWPCYLVLDASREGEVPDECDGDEVCQVKYGPGNGCLRDICLPFAEVEEGADCGLPQEGPTIPVCSASHYCSSTCQPRAALGEPCGSAACVAGAFCDGEADARTCVPRLPLGAPCPSDHACAEGLHCACPKFGSSCDERFCFEEREIGEPCSADPECPFPTRCEGGICKPSSLGFCEAP
ncbi:uncharacterized protein SOCEGT47_069750 [Sorangium cellulosum]|uniref:Uncharacterized protein n=1 Tax=Sorangium cellulosum TaxID=56 RepID=A0A4P2Q9W2_SORCE|nr:hypothetical protein [Sorangium cellulosum]AUX26414.1 uncharacterized protein SOCEGT47_069750 [Sorangium cellulosum]